jgi:hypothetical protein
MALGISAEINQMRETFFKVLFGPTARGYICLAYKKPGKQPHMAEEYFMYPAELPQLLESINRNYQQNDVYFCPQLFGSKRRRKETCIAVTAAWADLDECPPEVLQLEPSILVESSPGRYQALWCFDEVHEPVDGERISHNIAYAHRGDGCDQSGWDLTQLLRVPLTYNYKYDGVEVHVLKANRNKYRMDDFSYEDAPMHALEGLPFPEELPQSEPDDLMHAFRLRLIPTAWTLYGTEPQASSWNESLWQLMLLLFEAGMEPSQVLVTIQGAKCNKWKRDGKDLETQWKDVCRANARFEENTNAAVPRGSTLHDVDLLTDEERSSVQESDTFIERYIAWASSLGDAAPVYHQAGAFIALSSMLAGNVRLPTSFGTIIPNLWFMILADTTLTRKTTAMDIAMDLIMEVDSDVVLATDGSIEGLLTSLSLRPGRPSIFLRDEFSGLLEAITKKDYMAGMAETLTKMYDGKMQKRILRKEVIEVREPILLIFAGGIRNRVTGLLSQEHVSSGFLPRFIFITAESDPGRVRPLGPPTEANLGKRDEIRAELEGISRHYQTTQIVHSPVGPNVQFEQKRMFEAKLGAEAWQRYNELDAQLMGAGLESERPDLLTPTYARLAISTLKAATLIAASEQREGEVIVEVWHLLKAISYLEEWRKHMHIVMNNIGKGEHERLLDRVLASIIRNEGVTRGQLMQNYHLQAREADQIFTTLEQRQQIRAERVGKGTRFFALTRGK